MSASTASAAAEQVSPAPAGQAPVAGHTTAPAETALPVGRLRYALYRRALLRGTGFDVGPLLELGTARDFDHPAEALEASLEVLRTAFADPRLREAVAQSNPAYHDVAFAPGRPMVTATGYADLVKRGRRQVRTAHRYLRRLLGKTETNSFFGPTLVVCWDPDAEELVRVGEPAAPRCVTGLSQWVIDDLALRHWRARPAARRGFRRDPLWRHDDEVLSCALSGRQVRLSASAGGVWQALTTPGSPADLRERTSLPGHELSAALSLLAPALRPWPSPPSTLVDGVDWLVRHGCADDLLERLAKLLDGAASTAWPDSHRARAAVRAELAAAGLRTGRAAGRHYADRDVVNEDRSSPWSGRVRLGRPALASMHRALDRLLPVMLLDAVLRQSDARQAVARSTEGAATGLVELAAREIEPVTVRAGRLRAALAALIPDDPALVEVRLSAEELTDGFAAHWRLAEVRADDQLAALPGFDLMAVGGPPGRGRWLLSECHDDSSSAIGGITSRVQPGRDFDAFRTTVTEWIDTDRMATVVGRRRSRHITPELPGLSIELSGVSGKPRGSVAAAAQVTVAGDGARVVHEGRRYQLYPGDVHSTLFIALSLPCLMPVPFAVDRPYTPRVVLDDGTVVQRRRWRVELPVSTRGRGGWPAIVRWRHEHGLPDRVFLRHPDEPKPLLVDFNDPLALDELTRLRPAATTCTEVLPELTDTWWRSGGRQPSELRVPVFLRWDTGDRR